MNNTTTVTVGSGKSIHWGSNSGTICGAAHRSGLFTAPKNVKADTATCKRCVRIAASKIDEDHTAALEIQAERVEAIRAELALLDATVAVDVAYAEGETVYRLADGAKGRVLGFTFAPDGHTVWVSVLMEDGEIQGGVHTAFTATVPSAAFPAAVPLNTWLTRGLVLVGPATDSLYEFRRWDGGTAVLLHPETGALIRIAQADVLKWRYLPGADAATLAEEARTVATPEAHAARYHAGTSCVQGDACPFPHADRVRVGDRVQFVAGGDVRTVREVEHHAGTDLYSFGVRHSVRQFVRHSTEQVRRVVALEGAR